MRNPEGPATEGPRKWILGEGEGKPGLLGKANLSDEDRKAIHEWGWTDGQLTKGAASKIIETLKDDPEGGAHALLKEIGALKDSDPDEDNVPF
jgi:hypothetical protein